MNWIESLQKTISYMEDHLLEPISPQEIAACTSYSPGHLAQGFQIVTGLTFAEYIRSRRLYLAGMELASKNMRVLDAALKYGYDSPDAFARAFRKFHGFNPNQAGDPGRQPHIFLPFQIQICVRGGNTMQYEITNIPAFEVIGKVYTIRSGENPYEIIPQLWNEFMKGIQPLDQADKKAAIWQNNIGEFGICFDGADEIEYMIAGKYRGGSVPEGYEVRTIPALTWTQFVCYGPVPDALQKVNTQIFSEWLPHNPQYALDQDLSLEYYPIGDGQAADYQSQIWIPVKKK